MLQNSYLERKPKEALGLQPKTLAVESYAQKNMRGKETESKETLKQDTTHCKIDQTKIETKLIYKAKKQTLTKG